jgi:hypothetical protein
VISAGAGSSTTVVTSFIDTTPTLVVVLLVFAFLTQKLELFDSVKEQQLCVTMFLAFAVVKEGREQQTDASIVT